MAECVNLRQLPVNLRRAFDRVARAASAQQVSAGAWPPRMTIDEVKRALSLQTTHKPRMELCGLGLLDIQLDAECWMCMQVYRFVLTEKGRTARWGSKPPRSKDTMRTGGAGPAAKGSSTPAAPTGTPIFSKELIG